MPDHSLVDDEALVRSEIVANNAMNRERGIAGPNSYAKDLGFDPVAFLLDRLSGGASVSWLDLCCGSGKALIQAAEMLRLQAASGRVQIVGVDLVPMFRPIPAGIRGLELIAAPVGDWKPKGEFDLITCVHGLHYVGDKLGLLKRACGWLKEDGRFLAHLDLANLRLRSDAPRRHSWSSVLARAELTYVRGRRLVDRTGRLEPALPYRYLGANDQVGRNCTGQPAVDSWYEHKS
jgi:SAM-dependent methyltransferase